MEQAKQRSMCSQVYAPIANSIRSSISTSTPQISDNLTHQPMPLTTHIPTCHLDPLQILNLNPQGVLSVFKCNNRLGVCAPY